MTILSVAQCRECKKSHPVVQMFTLDTPDGEEFICALCEAKVPRE